MIITLRAHIGSYGRGIARPVVVWLCFGEKSTGHVDPRRMLWQQVGGSEDLANKRALRLAGRVR